MSVPHPNALPGLAAPVRTTRAKRRPGAIRRLLASARNLWDGSSFEPDRDWLRRVESGERPRTDWMILTLR